jgi:uncharacterized membrane protein YgcG
MIDRLEKQLQSALRMEVPSEARDRIRAEVMAVAEPALAELRPVRPASRRRFRLLRTVAIAVAPALLLFAGTALAATGAQPDSWLYPLKQKTEEARVILAYQALDQARVEVGHAGRRLDEIEEMQNRGKPEYVPGLISSYDDHISRAKELISEAAARGEDASEVDNMMAAAIARHDNILQGTLDGMPDNSAETVTPEMGASPTPASSGSPEGGMQGGSSSMDGNQSGQDSGGSSSMGGGTGGQDSWDSDQGGSYDPAPSGGMYDPGPSSGMDSGGASSGGQSGGGSSSMGGGSGGQDSGGSDQGMNYDPMRSGGTYAPGPSSGMGAGGTSSGMQTH